MVRKRVKPLKSVDCIIEPEQLVEKKKKTGRPLLPVKVEDVEVLAMYNCTVEEIGSCLNISPAVLHARFQETLKKGRDIGHMSIKRKLFEQAMSGNTAILIWLSKVHFGWKEEALTMNTVINVSVREVP